MTISTNAHRGVITKFDDLKGQGLVKLHNTNQEFQFRASVSNEDVYPGDEVNFKVSPGPYGGLLAYGIEKVRVPQEQTA